ncbi:hypothetical protein PIB30_088018 [Stylosanthes scabra]|uniref:Uncharacterized protein n=1 Tax=Stylosanthes scabra TaxID=79078 RepID=A0ABU6QT35_9FABA|nr:hypothetical protein [Stylosanthes scabra]
MRCIKEDVVSEVGHEHVGDLAKPRPNGRVRKAWCKGRGDLNVTREGLDGQGSGKGVYPALEGKGKGVCVGQGGGTVLTRWGGHGMGKGQGSGKEVCPTLGQRWRARARVYVWEGEVLEGWVVGEGIDRVAATFWASQKWLSGVMVAVLSRFEPCLRMWLKTLCMMLVYYSVLLCN